MEAVGESNNSLHNENHCDTAAEKLKTSGPVTIKNSNFYTTWCPNSQEGLQCIVQVCSKNQATFMSPIEKYNYMTLLNWPHS